MGRLTEVFATVNDGFGDKHRYSYIRPYEKKTKKLLKRMRRKKKELEKIVNEQATDMKYGRKVIVVAGW